MSDEKFVLGENLTSYPNLNFLLSESLEGLRHDLSQIRLPHKILSFYFDGKNHVAWVSTTRPLKKSNKGVKYGLSK